MDANAADLAGAAAGAPAGALVRAAGRGDAGAIARIWNDIIREPHITFTTTAKTEAAIAALIEERTAAGRAVLVAEASGVVSGFASYEQFRGGPGYARTMEHSINLDAAARGRGVGRALMQALEAHAAARGVHGLVAGISGANPGAVSFHARLGFTVVGRVPEAGHKHGRYLDLILMHKRLGPGSGA